MVPITPHYFALRLCPLCANRAIAHSIFLWIKSFWLPLNFFFNEWPFGSANIHSSLLVLGNVPSLLFSFSPPLEEQLTFLDASAGVRWTVLLTTVAKSVLTSILSMWNDVPFPTLPAIQQLLMVMDSYFWVLYGFWLISSHYFLQVLCRILSLELIELKSFPKMTFGFNDIYVPLTSAIYIYILYIYMNEYNA